MNRLRCLLSRAKELLQFRRNLHSRRLADGLYETETSPRYQGNHFTRVFANSYFDLYVWYKEDREAVFGFQLCYNKGIDEHSLTWTEKGYKHNRIDDGETRSSPTGYKMAAVLEPDGAFDARSIAQRFLRDVGDVETEIASLVYAKLRGYCA